MLTTSSRSSEAKLLAAGLRITSTECSLIAMTIRCWPPLLAVLRKWWGQLKNIVKLIISNSGRSDTDPRPKKCKTKCMAFLKKDMDLPNIMLCGNPLPWVKEGVYLGNYVENSYNGISEPARVSLRSSKVKVSGQHDLQLSLYWFTDMGFIL